MKSKYEDIFEELQQLNVEATNHEFDRLFRKYINDCRDQHFGIISYVEFHLLTKTNTITEAWIINEIKSQKSICTTLGTSISLGLENSLSGFKAWMKGRRKEKIAHILFE
ncbi:hypothetical protein ABID22_003834 [Pontibacter aydingkolensis]|uniref:Uncharacterized protein n=1 Tax=Pontibacter aydingkolensis TaxID=1911536 RepID=A0ABS7CZM6_9BACT|nr:hypothetical protein [Pontibacter aydingkolensis]MBW7469126.1 hypothetical protein [Pontibacter aydingkolensis]